MIHSFPYLLNSISDKILVHLEIVQAMLCLLYVQSKVGYLTINNLNKYAN